MQTKKCVVKGCDRLIKVDKHKLCGAHATRMYRKGDVGSAKIQIRKKHKPYKP